MDWIHVDWRKTNRELADELGYTMVTVNKARKKYYPDDPYNHDGARFWDAIDWRKSDAQIMQETGATYSAVHDNRHKYDTEYAGGHYSMRKRAARIYREYLAKHSIKPEVKKVSWLYR